MILTMTANTENQKSKNAIKKHQKHKKQDSSDSSSSNSDSSNERNYKIKRHDKNTSHRERDPIKLCAKLTANLLTTAYKTNIIEFKFNEDPLQYQIYFLTLIESPEMVFSHYKETCEVIL